MTRLFCILALFVPVVARGAEPGAWATYRGNPQRTGNTDNAAGPEKPAILWSVKSNDHFIASPVPVKDGIYVAGIGAFNRPSASLFPLASKSPPTPTWVKSAPYLKLASVSSPAVAGDYLLFGDGIHQDSGGVLHCVSAATSKPLWQLTLPGDLIHLEGTPVVANGKVFIGGGAAGVLCVEMDKATLDGKEYDLAAVAKMQEAKWKELTKKYEELKAKKDDFAIPPDDGQLLKFAPKKLWQKGEKKWHVDAPVNLAGDNLLVPTSYLDKEKVGERALYALNAATGETAWKRGTEVQPVGRRDRRGRSSDRARKLRRLLLQGTEGREGRRHRARPEDRRGEVAEGDSDRRRAGLRGRERRPRGLHRDRRQGARVQVSGRRAGLVIRREGCRCSRRPRWPAAWCTRPTWAAQFTPST